MPKYPDITVWFTGKDSNTFNILGICLQAMRRADLSQEERDTFQAEATSGNYTHLLATCMEWFEVEWSSKILEHLNCAAFFVLSFEKYQLFLAILIGFI